MPSKQQEAYLAVMRVLYLTPLTQEHEILLKELRSALNVTLEQHHDFLLTLLSDGEFNSLREQIKKGGRGSPGSVRGAGSSRRPAAAAALAVAEGGVGKAKVGNRAAGEGKRRSANNKNLAKLVSHDISFPSPPAAKQDTAALAAAASAVAPAAVPPAAPVSAAAGAAAAAPPRVTVTGEEVNRLVMHEIWRFWPEEGNKWIKGLITDWRQETNEHCVTYYLNTPEEEWEWIKLGDELENKEQAGGWKLAGIANVQLAVPQSAAQTAERRRTGTASRSGRRRSGLDAVLPIFVFEGDDSLTQEIQTAPVEDLQRINKGLDMRIADISAELMLLKQLEYSPPDTSKTLELQLDALCAHERAIQAELAGLQEACLAF